MKLYNDKCEHILPTLSSKSVDAIICDLPYGTTACSWDNVIDFEFMWRELNRIIKPNGAIVLFGSMPFSAKLVYSNIKNFRHGWVYKKRCASNFAQAKYSPLKEHEDILVFGLKKVNYYPIKEERKGSGIERAKYPYTEKSRHACGDFVGNIRGEYNSQNDSGNDILRYPSSIQEFNNRAKGDRGFHPTQKPLALMEYLVKTYTLEGQTVLDFAMGSGTTGVACKNIGRDFIGIEKEKQYFDIAEKRINNILI